MTIRTPIFVLFLIFAASTLSAPTDAQPQDQFQFMPGSLDEFKLLDQSYLHVHGAMKARITSTRTPGFELENPLLHNQFLDKPPPLWFVMRLYGRGIHIATVAIRSDNLYLSGFSNWSGQWFSFKGDSYKIPGSYVLNFGSDYRSLMAPPDSKEAAWKYLIGIDLDLEAILEAVEVISTYDPENTPDAVIKQALAKITVAFIEAQRFPYIRERVRNGWSNGVQLDDRGAFLVVNWKRISCALLIYVKNQPIWDSQEARKIAQPFKNGGLDIATPEQAKAEIWPILKVKKCSKAYE